MIVVQHHIRVRNGFQDQFETGVKNRWGQLKQLPGFYSGKVYRIIGTTRDYMATEQWKSLEEYEAAKPGIEASPLTDKIRSCVVGNPQTKIFEMMQSTWDQH
jgi:heme-degrading monooxygenase HmoA